MKQDITHTVERLDAFEERVGVRIEAVSAFLGEPDDDGEWRLEVNGELHSLEGTSLRGDLKLQVAAYDSQGRLVKSEESWFESETFFGFEPFEFRLYVPTEVCKIRLLPKAT